jgi:hypothetical protein
MACFGRCSQSSSLAKMKPGVLVSSIMVFLQAPTVGADGAVTVDPGSLRRTTATGSTGSSYLTFVLAAMVANMFTFILKAIGMKA